MTSQFPQVLADRYEIRDLIGRGDMAEVHLDYDTHLSRVVAIKLLRSDIAGDPTFQACLRREAQSAAALNHPTVVAVYDSGKEELLQPSGTSRTVPYVVMEYVEGHTVRELLNGGEAVPIAKAVEIASRVLDALKYSHRMGIVHRGIKPGDIMLTSAGVVKVTDFGIAQVVEDSTSTVTQTCTVVDTAQYLSPEQARDGSMNARSDLYFTRCLLYELLTGQPPFQGDSAVAIAYRHMREVPRRPSSLATDIPESLDRVILKSPAKSRESRYQDAAHMRADLQAAARSLPMAAPAADSWSPTTSVMASSTAEPVQPTSSFAQMPSGASPVQTAKEAEEPEERPKSHAWVWVLMFLLFMTPAVVTGLWAARDFDNQPTPMPSPTISKVEVPSTSGQDKESAKKTIEDADLKFAKDEVANEEVGAGLAISSDPGKDTKTESGSTVAVYFSTGSTMTKVPDLSGKTQKDARKALKEAGLEGGNTSRGGSATVAKDRVIYTNPQAGNSVARGTTVDLVLSTGNASVPDVSGQDGATAKKSIEDADLQFKRGDGVASAEVEHGKATSSNPAADTSISVRGTITVSFSSSAAKVTIPSSLNGRTVGGATANLQKLGLSVTMDCKSSDKAERNKVVDSSPRAGEQIGADSTVNLTVSSSKDSDNNNNSNNNQQQPQSGNPNPGGRNANNGGWAPNSPWRRAKGVLFAQMTDVPGFPDLGHQSRLFDGIVQ